MTNPSRLTFWRIALALTVLFPFMVIWQLLGLAKELSVQVSASASWMGALAFLGMGGLAALLLLALTCFNTRERIPSLLEFPAQFRSLGFFLLPFALIGYTLIFTVPYTRDLLGDFGWVRALLFWTFAVIGMYGLKALKEDVPWVSALLLVVIFQATFHLLLKQIAEITAYPFAMGWSETSRYYYPSLFLSKAIFGARLPWPILHPSLHLLLVPPYWFDAPLWLHRFWQVFMRFFMLGLVAWALLRRLSPRNRFPRWLVWLWMLLALFQGPIYFHLAVVLFLVLWGFSAEDDRRTWPFVLIASFWSGLSRINWYLMPGLLAAVLFLLEVPSQGKNIRRYLFKPALWVVAGFVLALVTQRAYITLSGIPDPRFFYTSLNSTLLWYRLFPNASYQYGVLPAALIASIPLWAAMFIVLRKRRADIHPLRLGLIFAALLVLFAGGLLVSMKIGGGVDIHNLDAYLGMLLIVTAYLVFARYAPEIDSIPSPVNLHWSLLALLVTVPAWFALQGSVSFKTYNPARTESVLAALQSQVDAVNERDGEILFITQRHLISMHMLDNVEMVADYEREELMEMAMGNNQDYLQIFRADMDKQRFDMIIVDPLNYRLLGKNYAFGEENNAWVRRAMKPILCNYEEALVIPEDQIAIYVPQVSERQCP